MSDPKRVFATGATRQNAAGKGAFGLVPIVALVRWALRMEQGASIHSPRNWERGIPLSSYAESAIRHLVQAAAGMTDEDHLAAVLFNVGAWIHTQAAIEAGQLPAELNDLPDYSLLVEQAFGKPLTNTRERV